MDARQIPGAERFRGQRVLVTGGSGFVGANLVRTLAGLGAEVHGTVRSGSLTWRLDSLEDAVTFHTGDLGERAFVDGLVEAIRPRFVFHLAAHGSNQAQSDPYAIIQANVVGTLNLLEAACRHPPERFVYVGTSSEYGAVEGAMNEDSPTHPASHYAITKLAGTQMCTLYGRQRDLKTVTFRLFTIYGPWMEPARLIPVVMKRASRGESVNLTSQPIQHDFLYVDDAVEALLSAPAGEFPPGDVMNLCTGKSYTNEEVVTQIGEALHCEIRVVKGGYPEHSWDIQNWVGSNQHASERLGWRPRHSLSEGLALTWQWMQRHPATYGIGAES